VNRKEEIEQAMKSVTKKIDTLVQATTHAWWSIRESTGELEFGFRVPSRVSSVLTFDPDKLAEIAMSFIRNDYPHLLTEAAWRKHVLEIDSVSLNDLDFAERMRAIRGSR
jgi:hypothetical protein